MSVLHKTVAAVAMKAAAPRTFRFRLSDGNPDREGDRVMVSGWDLTQYKRAPVVLWAHDHSIPAIARATALGVQGNALWATAEFPPPGIHPLADQIHDLVAAGFIASTSVGFLPLDTPQRNTFGGVDFSRQELLEYSIVNVGANANALLVGRGVADAGAVRKWLGDFDDDAVLVLADDDEDDPVLDLVEDDEDDDVVVDAALVEAIVKDTIREALTDGIKAIPAAVKQELGRRRGRICAADPLADQTVILHHQRRLYGGIW